PLNPVSPLASPAAVPPAPLALPMAPSARLRSDRTRLSSCCVTTGRAADSGAAPRGWLVGTRVRGGCRGAGIATGGERSADTVSGRAGAAAAGAVSPDTRGGAGDDARVAVAVRHDCQGASRGSG